MSIERTEDPSLAVVYVHIHRGAGKITDNRLCRLRRIPVVGEYLSLGDPGPYLYETRLVVHAGFAGADSDAEIFVVEVPEVEVHGRFMRGE